MLAFAAFVIAAVLFVLGIAADTANDYAAWGFVLVAIGLALQSLPAFGPAWPAARRAP